MFFFYRYINSINNKRNTPLQVDSVLSIQHRKKRTSQSASEEGSITVEAAIVIPLLLCAFLAVLMWGRIFLLHQEIESALLETARQLARQEYLLSIKEKEGLSVLAAGFLFEKNREQGDGSRGIEIINCHLAESGYREEDKTLWLKVRYQIAVPVFFLGTWRIPLSSSVVQKAWNGYEPKLSEQENQHTHVYITEHGDAYHTDSQCYHLHVSVQEVENITDLYGNQTRFRPCEYCVAGKQDRKSLYITEDGECYHEDPACSGLTRTVEYVEFEKAEGKQLCADCAGR